MLSKSFKPAKCKTSLKLAVARIKVMRNKREVQVKMMRRELAPLLESGQDQTARIRVEHVIREEKTMSAYDLIELYCELLVARLPIIESQKSCPIDLKEAVASVVFASPRCADVPELMDIRKHFAAKYGKEFINSALEVRPDCGVSRLIVEKLSARAPDIETKVKTLTAIAQEHNVKWDSKSFEEELQKPHDDLLNGPTSFASAGKMPMESSYMKSSAASIQTNESSMKLSQNFPETNTRTPHAQATRTPHAQANELSIKMPQNDTASRPTSFNYSSETRVPGVSVPFAYNTESRTSEDASLNRPTWSMGFPDATTAAQAAAESAERASMAARAAAELASRGNLSRQNSAGSNDSPRCNKKYERPENLRTFLGEHVVDETVPKVNDELKSSQGMRTEVQNLQKDERMPRIPSREAFSASNDYSTGRRPPRRSSSFLSSQGSVNDEMLNVNSMHKVGVKDFSSAQRISSYESEAVEPNHLNMKYGNFESSRDDIDISSTREPYSQYVTDDKKFWNSNIYKNENYEGRTSGLDAGQVSFGSNHKKSTSGDSSAVVFDHSDSDAEDNNSVFRSGGNLLDSYQGEERSSFQSNKGPFGVDQNTSESFAKNDRSRLHLFTESRPKQHSETMTKVSFCSQSIDGMPPAFDSSDGEGTKNEDEEAYSAHKEATRPSNFLHHHRQTTKSSFSDICTPQSTHVYMGETEEIKETARNPRAYTERDSYAADTFNKRCSSSNVLDNQTSPRSIKVPSHSNVSDGDSGYSSTDEEGSQPLRVTKRQPMTEPDAKERSQLPSRNSKSEGSEASNELSNESGQGINFGRLTGGFKQRGFPRPPYVRSFAADASISEKLVAADWGKQPESFEVAKNERCNQESQRRPYALNSRTSKASMDSQFDNAEGPDMRYSTEDTLDIDEALFASNNAKITGVLNRYNQKDRMKANKEASSITTYSELDDSQAKLDSRRTRDVKLSRRTRDVPSESKSSSSSAIGPHRDTTYDSVTIQGKGSLKPVQSNPSSEHPSVAPKQMLSTAEERPKSSQLHSTGTVVPTNKENTKPSTSSGESVSRESSLKKASHTHPKLPDYDTFAAHFHSLRSNRQ